MAILHRMWLQRLAFDRLVTWRTRHVAARRMRRALGKLLLQRTWTSWSVAVQLRREQIVRGTWYDTLT